MRRDVATWMSVIALFACRPDAANPVPDDRRVLTSAWDTLYQVGSGDMDDVTFADPIAVVRWNGGVVVADRLLSEVIHIDTAGRIVRRTGRQGAAPGEYRFLTHAVVAPNGNLWVVDERGGKIEVLDSTLQPVRAIRGVHPRIPAWFEFLADTIVVVPPRPSEGVLYLDTIGLRPVRHAGYPWREGISDSLNASTWTSAADDYLVAAFWVGPGFMVLDRDGADSYDYIRRVPFFTRWSMDRADDPNTFIREYAARAVQAVGDTVYILFGGRPGDYDREPEPPRFIDVYTRHGEYLHSLEMPVHADLFETDGSIFYVVQTDPYPSLLALRPRLPR